MNERLSICLGVFSVMALSNTIIPVLPLYAASSTIQGAIYSAYFFGACIITFPAGLLSDRYGRVPIIRSGLVITLLSGALLFLLSSPMVVIGVRFLEGIGAGLFVAAAMAYVNSMPDHKQMSGYFMATLNLGLVLGLVAGGSLVTHFHVPGIGISLFTILTIIPAVLSVFLVDPHFVPVHTGDTCRVITTLLMDYRRIWFSAIVLIGITGVITSLYPEYSDMSPDTVGIWIAGMSIATIVAVLFISRLTINPVIVIRISAILMAGGILVSYFSPTGFLIVGALAGVVMIAQMALLAQARNHQGAAMGLFSTAGYLGMSLLPLFAGIIADVTTFFIAFCVTALVAISVFLTIGSCDCHQPVDE
jgi:MFS family permease